MAKTIEELKAEFNPRTNSPMFNAVHKQLQEVLDNFPESGGPPPDLSAITTAISNLQTAVSTLQSTVENLPTTAGEPGLSAYQIAVANNFVGDEAAWLASLKGEPGNNSTVPGPSAYEIAVANNFVGDEAAWLASLKGEPGAASTVPGPPSTVPGPPGPSAYEVAVANNFVGDEAAWLASLVGPPSPLNGDDYVAKSGATMTGALEVSALRNTQAVLNTVLNVVTLDFSENSARVVTLDGDVEFVTANRAAGRIIKVFINPGVANRTPTWPSAGNLWKWFCTAPTLFTANKWTILTLECTDTTDAGIVANALEQP